MTITAAMKSVSNQWLSKTAAAEYSEPIIADTITQVAATNTTYNRDAYSHGAAGQAGGALPYVSMTSSYWYDSDGEGGYDRTAISPTVVQGKINDFLATPNDRPMQADIEAWDLTDPTEYVAGIANLQLALGMWRDQTTRFKGLWSMFPTVQYTHSTVLGTVIGSGDKAAEAEKRSALSKAMILDAKIASDLLPYVDAVVPRVYQVAEDNVALWKWFAAWTILESINIAGGKPVYPSVWFRYGRSYDEAVPGSGYFPLSEANFRLSLQFIAAFPGIAGIWLWEGGGTDGDDVPVWYTGVIEELIDGTGDFVDS